MDETLTQTTSGSSTEGENPSTEDSNSFDSFNPNIDGNSFTSSDDADGTSSMTNADFNGIDTGTGNTDNGNGNNFLGDSEGNSGSNNLADGNGNWFYGNDNQANGNGNWNFGSNNNISGNGNWNLNEESGTPFDSIFAGENNPFSSGNPSVSGEEGGIPEDALGGNNPVFAGGSTMPTPVGEGEMPDTAENPTGSQNTVNGNGNWNFGSNNDTSGNGNWNFGDGNVVTDGNANWNLGDNNEVNGNGNRPSGNDNSISGNSNRVTGDGNSINGNRFNLDEDSLDIVGNADRYLQTDADGNVTLVSDESKSDPNYTFDFSGVVGASEDEGNEEVISEEGDLGMTTNSNSGGFSGAGGFGGGSPSGGDAEDANSAGSFSGGAPNSNTNPDYDFSAFEPSGEGDINELIRQSPFGVLLDLPGIDSAEDIFGNVGASGAGGSSPFGGGAGGSSFGGGNTDANGGAGGGGNPFANFNPLEDGNPFVEGDEPNVSFGGAGSFGGGGSSFGGSTDGFGAATLPETGEVVVGSSGSYIIRDDEGNWYASEDDAIGDDDTSLSNPEVSGFGDTESTGNPFGGNPFEYNPVENLPDSEDTSDKMDESKDIDHENTSDKMGGGEDLHTEDDSGKVTDYEDTSDKMGGGEDLFVGEDSPFGDGAIEFEHNYHWDFGFENSDSANQDSDSSNSGVPELEDGTQPLMDEMDLENSLGEAAVFDLENSKIQLPNGATINPFNENGEFDLSINAPVMNEEGLMAGELNIAFPEYVEDYFSSVFNLDEVQEFNSESEILSIQDDFNSLFGVDAPVLGEDNVLQFSGGFEIDLSEIMSDSGDSAI